MKVSDRHLDTIEKSIGVVREPYPDQTYVYIFRDFKDGEKYTCHEPLDKYPDLFFKLVKKYGPVVDMQVMKG